MPTITKPNANVSYDDKAHAAVTFRTLGIFRTENALNTLGDLTSLSAKQSKIDEFFNNAYSNFNKGLKFGVSTEVNATTYSSPGFTNRSTD